MAGRGGRGRGRFGRGQPSVAQDLIRDNLEDLGVDSFNGIGEDTIQIPPVLYPSITLPAPYIAPFGKDENLSKRYQTIVDRMHEGPYYLQRNSSNAASLKRKRGADNSVEAEDIDTINPLDLLTNRKNVPEEWKKIMPIELFDWRASTEAMKKNKDGKPVDSWLQNLEQAEKKSGNGGAELKTGDEEEEEPEDEEGNQEDEFEMDDDYMVDHYASDNDRDDGDDHDEAVF